MERQVQKTVGVGSIRGNEDLLRQRCQSVDDMLNQGSAEEWQQPFIGTHSAGLAPRLDNQCKHGRYYIPHEKHYGIIIPHIEALKKNNPAYRSIEG